MATKKDFERTKARAYAEKYWKENGFDVEVKRVYMSKVKYIIRKDGMEFPYEVPYDVTDPKMYMKFFAEQYEMRKILHEKGMA